MEISGKRGGLPKASEGRGGLPEGRGELPKGLGELAEGRERLPEDTLASDVAAVFERLLRVFRSLSPASGLSLTAAATLTTLERSGPSRLTWLAVREGVTQPAMTQLIARLEDAGLVDRAADPTDGRVVRVGITADGMAMLADRRAVRAKRLAALLDRLSLDEREALAAALPAMDALASAQRGEPASAQRGEPASAQRGEPSSAQRAEPTMATGIGERS
jgi:DNA-binding MarR family transcriptional regulator